MGERFPLWADLKESLTFPTSPFSFETTLTQERRSLIGEQVNLHFKKAHDLSGILPDALQIVFL